MQLLPFREFFFLFLFSSPRHAYQWIFTDVAKILRVIMDMYLWILSEKCSILKSKYISLPTKVHIIKAMVFPVVMYGYETWTIKKAEHQRIDAFELWCWRRLLRVPWTARRSHHKGNQFWIFTGRTDAEAETQIPGHLMWRTDSLEKTLMLGKIKGRRRRGRQRLELSDGITDSMDWAWV